mgnify:FL=1
MKDKEDYAFKLYDLCEATQADDKDKKFKCTLTRYMRDWAFSAWEVRICEPGKMGWVTHVRTDELKLIKAFDPEKPGQFQKRSWR